MWCYMCCSKSKENPELETDTAVRLTQTDRQTGQRQTKGQLHKTASGRHRFSHTTDNLDSVLVEGDQSEELWFLFLMQHQWTLSDLEFMINALKQFFFYFSASRTLEKYISVVLVYVCVVIFLQCKLRYQEYKIRIKKKMLRHFSAIIGKSMHLMVTVC